LEKHERHGPFPALKKQAWGHSVLQEGSRRVSEGCLHTLYAGGTHALPLWVAGGQGWPEVRPSCRPLTPPGTISLERFEKWSRFPVTLGKATFSRAWPLKQISASRGFCTLAGVLTSSLTCVSRRAGHSWSAATPGKSFYSE